MKPLQDVFSDYLKTVEALDSDPMITDLPCLVAIRHVLPGFFSSNIRESGRVYQQYQCFGGYTEPDLAFAKIPWIYCRDRCISSTIKDSFVIALLFREDFTGCWLSLSRGSAQYEDNFGLDSSARHQSQISTNALTRLIDIPVQFFVGPIDLGATTGFGMNHETGAGVSKFYSSALIPTEKAFAADFLHLLELYDRLAEGASSYSPRNTEPTRKF